MKHSRMLFLLLPLLIAGLAACADSAKPEDAVIPYLEALLSNDEQKLNSAICPAWEADAKRDLDAFTGVTGTLKDASCNKTGSDGDTALIACTGTMELDYNGELRDRSLEGTTYRVDKIDGDWKVCGYN